MRFNRYSFRIAIHIVAIVITSLVFAWSLNQEYMVATSAGLGALLLIESFSLYHYSSKMKRDVQRFLDAIKNEDTSLVFKKNSKDTFLQNLHEGFNEIISDFKLIRKEKEIENHFFQYTVQHISIGLLAIDWSGKVKLINSALKTLFQLNHLSEIRDLSKIHKDLPDLLHSLQNEEEGTLKILINGELKPVSIRAGKFRLGKEEMKIFSFHDISKQVNRSEVEAWQKLIRILRHEIINSISPIKISSVSMLRLVEEHLQKGNHEFSGESLENLQTGLQTIHKRSSGLSDFVETYRSLTKIPDPRLQQIEVKEIFTDVYHLYKQVLVSEKIEFDYTVEPETLNLITDEKLLQQVLVNLVKNAKEALKTNSFKKIKLEAYKKDQVVVIKITDNGRGMSPEEMEQAFVPFYTTKEQGSGIGLSLSRQLVQKLNGRMQLQSEKGKYTTATLQF